MSQEAAVSAEAQGVTEAQVESGSPPEPSQAPQTATQEPQAVPRDAQSVNPTPEIHQEETAPTEDTQGPEEASLEQLPAGPEGYRVNLPEGVEADPVMVEGLKRFAHRNQWTQDQVDGLAEFWSGYAEFQKRQGHKQVKAWDDQIRADWGRSYPANRQKALKGLSVAGERVGKELGEILNRSGMTNHPAVNRFLCAVGTLMSEDTFVRGAPNPVTIPRDPDGRPILKFKKM